MDSEWVKYHKKWITSKSLNPITTDLWFTQNGSQWPPPSILFFGNKSLTFDRFWESPWTLLQKSEEQISNLPKSNHLFQNLAWSVQINKNRAKWQIIHLLSTCPSEFKYSKISAKLVKYECVFKKNHNCANPLLSSLCKNLRQILTYWKTTRRGGGQ